MKGIDQIIVKGLELKELIQMIGRKLIGNYSDNHLIPASIEFLMFDIFGF